MGCFLLHALVPDWRLSVVFAGQQKLTKSGSCACFRPVAAHPPNGVTEYGVMVVQISRPWDSDLVPWLVEGPMEHDEYD